MYEDPTENPDDDWYCPRCKPTINKRQLDNEEKRQRSLLKEQAAIERKKKLDDQKYHNKLEFDRKREEKRLEKEKEENEKIRNREEK